MGTPRYIPSPTEAATLARSWVSHFSKPTAIGMTLAFVAGYIDVVGFIALFGLFTAHVTGNFVLIGRSAVEAAPEIFLKLLVFPVFMLFVAIARLLILHWQRTGGKQLRQEAVAQLLAARALPVQDQQACDGDEQHEHREHQ